MLPPRAHSVGNVIGGIEAAHGKMVTEPANDPMSDYDTHVWGKPHSVAEKAADRAIEAWHNGHRQLDPYENALTWSPSSLPIADDLEASPSPSPNTQELKLSSSTLPSPSPSAVVHNDSTQKKTSTDKIYEIEKHARAGDFGFDVHLLVCSRPINTLLSQLSAATCNSAARQELFIHIDRCGSKAIYVAAHSYKWPCGKTTVLHAPAKRGPREL